MSPAFLPQLYGARSARIPPIGRSSFVEPYSAWYMK